MDDRRFDRFAKKFATSSIGRRGIIAAFVGAAVWSQARNADSAQPTCAGDGAYCGMWQHCCPGTVCHVYATNPNSGTCRPGTDINGTGLVMLGPGGQILAAQAVPTSTVRPTRTPKPTKTPKPTQTPKARRSTQINEWNLVATVECFDKLDPSNNQFVEKTTITNTGRNPLLLSAIASVQTDAVFRTSGSTSDQEIVVAAGQVLVVRSNDVSNEPMTDSKELFGNNKREEARILVQKLNGTGTPYSVGGGFMEFRARCNGDPSYFVPGTPVLPTTAPSGSVSPVTLTSTPEPSEKRKKRRKKSRQNGERRTKRNRNASRKNRD